jgi:CheY-like chemotaxis protein
MQDTVILKSAVSAVIRIRPLRSSGWRPCAWGHTAPVILIAASPDESVRASSLEADAIGFLAKPFAVHSLITCLPQSFADGAIAHAVRPATTNVRNGYHAHECSRIAAWVGA